jgi:sugar lactone lactonase YvrE
MAILKNWLRLAPVALIAGALSIVTAMAQEEGAPAAAPSGPHLDFPAGLDTDGTYVYVANSRNNTIARLDMVGNITIVAGKMFQQGSNDGKGSAALFNSPDGLAFYSGALYVSDTNNSDIRKIDLVTSVVTTVAGTANISGTENGHGTAAHFNLPTQICSDGKGTLYIVDTDNSQVRKIVVADMTISTIGGQAPNGDGKEDGPPAKSKFNHPRGLATDGKFLYVADTANNVIRKIDLSDNTTSSFAGNGTEGNQNGKAAEAAFDHPEALATDGTTLYVADADNHAIRKITLADGTVSTLTLVNGHIGSGLAISKDGKTVYFSDTTENAVQKVDTSNGNYTSLYPKE